MNHPTFIGVGSARSGSTVLYNNLKEHPEIFMSPAKELLFFAFYGQETKFSGPKDNYRFIKNLDEYLKYFDGSENYNVRGEISPLYLYHSNAANNLHNTFPNVKIVISLRNPIDRAYSHFLKNCEVGAEPLLNFEKAISEEKKRIEQNWGPRYHYLGWGYYYEQVKRYIDLFGREKVFIYLYEDFKKDQTTVLRHIYEFLEVDSNFIPDLSQKYWTSPKKLKTSRSNTLKRFLIDDNNLKSLLKKFVPGTLRQNLKDKMLLINETSVLPELNEEFRNKLKKEFHSDILKLQDLIKMDLSTWK